MKNKIIVLFLFLSLSLYGQKPQDLNNLVVGNRFSWVPIERYSYLGEFEGIDSEWAWTVNFSYDIARIYRLSLVHKLILISSSKERLQTMNLGGMVLQFNPLGFVKKEKKVRTAVEVGTYYGNYCRCSFTSTETLPIKLNKGIFYLTAGMEFGFTIFPKWDLKLNFETIHVLGNLHKSSSMIVHYAVGFEYYFRRRM